jgi:hypothetical protein
MVGGLEFRQPIQNLLLYWVENAVSHGRLGRAGHMIFRAGQITLTGPEQEPTKFFSPFLGRVS